MTTTTKQTMNQTPQQRVAIQLCRPKTIKCEFPFSGVNNVFSGKTVLDYRMDDVLAMRVKDVAIIFTGADVASNPQPEVVLCSSVLASNLSYDLFRLASGANSGNTQAQTVSNVIGWSPRVVGATNTSATTLDVYHANNRLNFTRPVPIESFDWTVLPMSGNFVTTTGSYRVIFTIEFFKECQCQYVLKEY